MEAVLWHGVDGLLPVRGHLASGTELALPGPAALHWARRSLLLGTSFSHWARRVSCWAAARPPPADICAAASRARWRTGKGGGQGWPGKGGGQGCSSAAGIHSPRWPLMDRRCRASAVRSSAGAVRYDALRLVQQSHVALCHRRGRPAPTPGDRPCVAVPVCRGDDCGGRRVVHSRRRSPSLSPAVVAP